MIKLNFKKINYLFIISAFAFFAEALYSQSMLDNVLDEIKKNNKALTSHSQLMESKKIESMVGQTLYNPFIELSNYFGTSKSPGNQTEFKIIQSFDFPSVYSGRNKVSNLKIAQSDYEIIAMRQNILLEAKQICIKLVYHNKKKNQLINRLQSTREVFDLYQSKLNIGESNIIDLNKARLNLINFETDMLMAENEISVLTSKLAKLNGGKEILFSDTVYQEVPPIPDFKTIESIIEKEDPVRKMLNQEILISKSQVELSKSMSLPKFELGYYFLKVPESNFNGIHFGMTLPFWENNYKTDFYKSRKLYSDLELQTHTNEHYYETKELYDRYVTYRNTLEKYSESLHSVDNTELLDKALKAGEISSMEFFLETNYLYSAFDKYLELEMQYNSIVAELIKYNL